MTTIDYLRQFRIGEFAIFDFAASFLGMLLLSPLLSRLAKKFGWIVPRQNWVFLTIPVSILVHLLTGNMTPLTKEFLDPNGFYLVKLIVIGFCVLSATRIKRIPQAHS